MMLLEAVIGGVVGVGDIFVESCIVVAIVLGGSEEPDVGGCDDAVVFVELSKGPVLCTLVTPVWGVVVVTTVACVVLEAEVCVDVDVLAIVRVAVAGVVAVRRRVVDVVDVRAVAGSPHAGRAHCITAAMPPGLLSNELFFERTLFQTFRSIRWVVPASPIRPGGKPRGTGSRA
jgi:hypothetical protein